LIKSSLKHFYKKIDATSSLGKGIKEKIKQIFFKIYVIFFIIVTQMNVKEQK